MREEIITDVKKSQNFTFKAKKGQRFKKMNQDVKKVDINGVRSTATVLELESSLDAIRIVIPVCGCWSVINDYSIFFISREDMVVGVFVINIERV